MSAQCAICPMKWELLKAQLAMQFTLYNDDGADFWEVVLKSQYTTSQKAAHCTHNFSKVSSPRNSPYTFMMELTFGKLFSLHTQLLQSHRTAHTTSQQSAHYAVYPIQSHWSWRLRSCSQKSSHCTHSKLRTASQKSAHYTICPTTWELLKSHLTAHTANWEQLLNSQLTTQFALQHENFSKVDSPYNSLASVCKSWHICILMYSSWHILIQVLGFCL